MAEEVVGEEGDAVGVVVVVVAEVAAATDVVGVVVEDVGDMVEAHKEILLSS